MENGIIHYRIDDRLIHGIVAGLWTNFLKATRLMVIDDQAANDQMIRDSLRMAAPAAVALSVLTTQKAIDNINNNNYADQRVFVIAKSPVTFAKLMQANIKLDEVHMGNITYTEDRLKVAKTVSVNKEEVAALESLAMHKTKIISRLMPSDNPEDFMEMMKKAKEA